MTLRTTRRRFTLVELLIVIALIAVVSGMVVGLFGSAVDKSAATASMATQKQLVNQFNSYQQLHGNTLPDDFDSLMAETVTGTYDTVGTYSVIGEGTFDINVAADPTLFFRQLVPPSATTNEQYINRGVHLDGYTGANRTLTVKQLSDDDVRVLANLGITTLYDLRERDLFYGEPSTTARAIASGGPIAIVDPQTVAGQRLYHDFGIDLSNQTDFPRKGTDDAGTPWDDSEELTDAARVLAFQQGFFYVLGVGVNSEIVGDQLAGVQEPPTSAVVSQGFYNYFSLVIKKGAASRGDRNPGIAGVLDPRGRGASAARQAVNAIQ
ncbi:MAG TPA: hypothetical protein DEA08_11975 [Planctomycetes bacterium]|nr:hypothetical protein [Planctomycetota bacterium]